MNTLQIPKIIHQIWSGIDEPLPTVFEELGKTWKENHPEWEYILWDNEKMSTFIQQFYPQYWDIYNGFMYNIQRWDAIRYLILNEMGGMYVDFDYESILPLDDLLKEKSCGFALEPKHTFPFFKKAIMFNNALMFSIPKHPFMQAIINFVFSEHDFSHFEISKEEYVLNTTGPFRLIELYNDLSEEEKKQIYLVPAKYVTPFDGQQAKLVRMGVKNQDLENCLEEAYAIHYFISAWRNNSK
jgi:mannosyltransferase OCH1-like enzyme